YDAPDHVAADEHDHGSHQPEMRFDRKARLTDTGPEQGGDEKADAPEAMGAVHVAPAGMHFEPVDLVIEVDFERTGEESGGKDRNEARRDRAQPENEANEQRGTGHGEEGGGPRAQPADDAGPEGQRDQRADGHADHGKAELAL